MKTIKVPELPESVADATVAAWHKKNGEYVSEGDTIVDLETDKVMLEVPATVSGVLTVKQAEGAVVVSGDDLAEVDTSAKPQASEAEAAPVAEEKTSTASSETKKEAAPDAAKPAPSTPAGQVQSGAAGPSARRAMHQQGLSSDQIKGSGKDGRITAQDVAHYAETASVSGVSSRLEKRVPMTRLRARVAERLLDVQKNAAILTTFNEVDMTPVMTLRAQYKDAFEKKHGVRLGFMSFFVKAVVSALKAFPDVNASIDGQDIVYHNYFDVGIAVSSPRGLVVPVLRDAEHMSVADIESTIRALAIKSRDGKITLDEMAGGTFTITNGGVFGSMLSTPILNAPQSAILGMHNIVKRPHVVNDEIVIRSMMYLALSYDHRIVDGQKSVQFLVKIKEMLEDPARFLLDV
jgi:2-oxoglutarate dehydrogenase E2 component (dihydrolipoamide succinyltransferase)